MTIKELADNYAKGNKEFEESNKEDKRQRAIKEGKLWKLKKYE
jgi:hypothetical protein